MGAKFAGWAANTFEVVFFLRGRVALSVAPDGLIEAPGGWVLPEGMPFGRNGRLAVSDPLASTATFDAEVVIVGSQISRTALWGR
jgi:hypothetical protein